MAISEEVEEKLQAAATKTLEGKYLIRCLPFMREGSPMLHVSFKDGSKKNIRLQSVESRDRLSEIFKEQAWPFKKLLKNTGQSQSDLPT